MSGKKGNAFYLEDDEDSKMDDDEFLRRSKSKSSATRGKSSAVPSTASRLQALQERRRDLEASTVASSSRSVGLLYEAERVGVSAAEELNAQKEQLRNTEARLDDISASLTQSERHITGIKSVFGGIRNYFSGKSPNSSGANNKTAGTNMPRSAVSVPNALGTAPPASNRNDIGSSLSGNSSHPGLRLRGLEDDEGAEGGRASKADDVVDRNLAEMSGGLSRLKHLALGLNAELEEHNELIDRIDDKTAAANIRIDKQNKDMDRLLKGSKK